MIAVWIIAFSFTIVGAAFCFPKYYRIFTCKSVTSGKMLSWQSQRSFSLQVSSHSGSDFY